MMIGRKFANWVLAMLFGCGYAIAQNKPVGAEKAALINTLREIEGRARSIAKSAGNPTLRPITDDLSDSVDWLARSAEQWSPKERGEGQALLDSLQRMLKVLRDVPAGGPELETLLSAVSDDLRIKANHCSWKGLATRLQVNVVTKRNGLDEVKGLKVLYIEKFFQSDPNAKPQEFRGFSSPAVDSLVPGRYLFWAQETGEARRNGEQKEAAIGPRFSEQSIEVLAP
jgi:hypothetical protein